MTFPGYDHLYSSNDWRTMEQAHLRASMILGRHPKHDRHADRLARCIMNFFNTGEKDAGRLSGMAVKRELYLMRIEIRTVVNVDFMDLSNSQDVPQLLH